MPGLTFSNELISRDEGMHTDLACIVYKKLVNKLDKETIYKIVREAVDIEKEFIIDALPCRLIGMNSDLMSQYIEVVADRIIMQLGYKPIYNKKNPGKFTGIEIKAEYPKNPDITILNKFNSTTNKMAKSLISKINKL